MGIRIFMLKGYFIKLTSVFAILFITVGILSIVFSQPLLFSLLLIGLFLVFALSLYYMIISPLNEAFDNVSMFESRLKKDRKNYNNKLLRLSEKYPFIKNVFKKIHPLFSTLIDSALYAPGRLEALTINGKSWPYTERLRPNVGDTLRWRIINANYLNHPMHLHCFYYDVTTVGR